MATLREVLSFVITADAGDAIREFDKLEKSASKSAAETEGAFSVGNLTKVGAAAGAFALVAGGALVKVANQAADLDKSMSRVEGAFGESADSVKHFATNAQFLSDVDAARFAADIGEAAKGLGVTADQAGNLVPKVVDLASKLAIIKGLDMGTAMESISAALRGEYDATQRLDPALSAAAIQQRALADSGKENAQQLTTQEKALATLNILYEDFGGLVSANSDALESQSAKWTETKARLSDAATALGQGVLPAMEAATGVIKGLATGVSALPTPVTSAAGGLATMAVGLAAVTSAISFTAAGFQKLKGALSDSEGNLTKWGTALKGVGIALAALEISDQIFKGLNEATGNTQRFTDAMNDFIAKTGKAGLSARTMAKDFSQMVAEQDKGLHMRHLWDDWGADIVSNFDGASHSIEDTQAALDSLDPQSASDALDALQAVTDSLAKGSDQRKTNQEFIDKNRKSLKLEADAHKAAGDAAAAAAGGTDKNTASTKANEEAVKALDEALKGAKTGLDKWEEGLSVLAAGGEAAAKSMDLGSQTDNLIENASKMGQAVNDFEENVKHLPGAIDQTKLALGGYNEEQTKAIDSLTSLGAANRDYVSGLIASGASSDEVKMRAAALNEEYGKQLKAAGLTTAQVKEYQRILGLTDPDVETAIRLSGDEKAITQLQLLQADLEKIDDTDVQATIRQQILAGDYQGAVATAQAYFNKNPLTATVRLDTNAAKQQIRELKENSLRSVPVPPATPTPTPTYLDSRTITVNVTNPPGTRDTVKNIKRALKINGREMRKVLT